MSEANNNSVSVRTSEFPVLRSKEHEDLVSRLCTEKNSITGKTIFPTGKDLMIFAAMVGYTAGSRVKLAGRGSKVTTQIFLRVYESDDKDGFIYLLALLDSQDPLILKQERLAEAIAIFEEYCNAGLFEITNWLKDNQGDLEGADTLADQLYKRLAADSLGDKSNIKVRPSF
jgi:dnd system-associated protein 4